MVRIVKFIAILFLFSWINTVYSIEFQKAEHCVNEAHVMDLFEFNDNLFVTNNDDSNHLYKETADKWIPAEPDKFPKLGWFISFVQGKNIIYYTLFRDSAYISFDSGENWQKTEHTLYGKLVVIDNNIFGRSTVIVNGSPKYAYLVRLNTEDDKLDVMTYEENGIIDSIFTDCIATNGQYIVSGDSRYGRTNSPGGLYISSDKGNSWEKISYFDQEVYSVAIHNDIIFVGTRDKYLYKSLDFGKTWELVDKNIMPTRRLYSHGNQLFANVAYIPNENDSLKYGLLVSFDNGITWTKVDDGIVNTEIDDIIYHKNKYYVISGKKKLYETNDIFGKWTLSTIYAKKIYIRDLLFDSDTLFATGNDRGLQYSTDDGNKWYKYSQELSSKYYISDYITKHKEKIIVKGQWSNSFYLSTDNGKTWNLNYAGNITSEYWMHNFLILDDKIILTSKDGTKYTTDNGETWDNYENEIFNSTDSTYSIIKDADNLYMTTTKGLVKSDDLGKSWKLLNETIKHYPIQKYKSNLYAYDGKLILISTDDGITWGTFANQPPLKIRNYFFYIKNNIFFVAAYNYLYVSTDEGKNWQEYSLEKYKQDGEDYFIASDLEIVNDYLVLSSDYDVYRIKLTDLGIVPTNVESETERNYLYTYPPYPLPAKSEVKVLFYWDINIPMTVDDISIYDLSGQKIEAKNNFKLIKQANHYGNITWDCSTTPAGIYLINIKHGTESKSVKVVVE